eukprot:TRINITY_DN48200_c0_g1_i1.p1 TRINITY_DN48200_c0_g1~~TRINITY_DN48200_c0_g1_i1.p1  ORF type:complete len:334 (+),score=73.80 TRINITY_DN48200_c0_g1_i1:59-1060(+)
MGCGAYSKPKELTDKWYPEYVQTLPRMDGKVVAVTGCTTGTGLVCAKLCRQLGASVVLLNRDSERVAHAKAAVEASAGADAHGEVMVVACDLTNFASVRSAVGELNDKFADGGLDVLVNNAGVMANKDQATGDGYDIQMQTNHLSHFLLTAGVFPLLEKAAERGEARIVNHSSIARTSERKKGLERKYLDKKGGDLGGNGTSAKWKRYGQTKWANYVFTRALHDKLAAKASNVRVVVAHPGIAATNLQVSTVKEGNMPSFLAKGLVKQTANDGALGIIRGACAASVNSGEFYGPAKDGWKGPAEVLPEDPVTDADKSLIWECSEAATGTTFAV